ncbi:MAG: hypothetical protein V1880_04340 [Patescibacteria group bacterium]
MNNAEFKLYVEPTESRVARNESDFYTLRLPLAMLQEKNADLLTVLTDTGNVAFGHNKPDSKTVVVTCPQGATESLQWIKEALSQFNVEIREQAGSKFVNFYTLKGCSLGCVDRRLDDTGVDPISREAQITHAGGPLVLHPKLKDEMSVAHRVNLFRAMEHAKDAGVPVGNMNYHFGAEGTSGCGMYGVLSEANAKVRETLRGPEDIISMMRMIREEFGGMLSTDCRITGSVVLGSKDSITYNLDDPADIEALKAEKNLVL